MNSRSERETAPDASRRPALPLPFVTILLAETFALGGLVAASPARPLMTYEMGWLGVGSMLIMQLYSVRRRVRALRALGSLRAWLDAHVFLGLQGFVLVAYHSVGVSPSASLAAINFGLVAIVVTTGLVGRYLYGLIPRARAIDAIAYAELGETALRGMAPPAALRRECAGLTDLIGSTSRAAARSARSSAIRG
jgi:hypothetical protein